MTVQFLGGTPHHAASSFLDTLWTAYDFNLEMYGLYSMLLTPGSHYLRPDAPICQTKEMTPQQVMHLIQQMIEVRSVLVTRQGELGLIYDTGEQIVLNGPTRSLSDAALHLLLAWQQFRQPETLDPEGMQDLRRAGYDEIADELEQGVRVVPIHLWHPLYLM